MSQSGFTHTMTDDAASKEAAIRELEQHPEITAIIPAGAVPTYARGPQAPANIHAELDWFIAVAQRFLQSPKIFDSFESVSSCDDWKTELSPAAQAYINTNRLSRDNLSRINRVLAGFTTEAFSRELPSKLVHDDLFNLYSDFNQRFKPEAFYTQPLKQREQMADDMTQRLRQTLDILTRIEYLTRVDE